MSGKRLEDFLNIDELPKKPRSAVQHRVLRVVGKSKNLRKIVHDFYPDLEFDSVVQKKGKYTYVRAINAYGIHNKTLYAKATKREGPLRLALATELNNLLSGREMRYMLYSKKVIVSEEVKGRHFSQDEWDNLKEGHAYSLGILNEFSRVIGWNDIARCNFMLRDDGKIWNIDFGASFHHNSRAMLWSYFRPSDEPCFKRGMEDGKLIVRKNIETNFAKLKAILDSIDKGTYRRIKKESEWSMVHPKRIVLNYVKDNGWHDIERALS